MKSPNELYKMTDEEKAEYLCWEVIILGKNYSKNMNIDGMNIQNLLETSYGYIIK